MKSHLNKQFNDIRDLRLEYNIVKYFSINQSFIHSEKKKKKKINKYNEIKLNKTNKTLRSNIAYYLL